MTDPNLALNDRRYWILNPTGHRMAEMGHGHHTGDTIETPLGPATVIVNPPFHADFWVCDICNEVILTRWGAEAFPVPMEGSYALCANCFYLAQDSPLDDPMTGDPIPGTRMGEWPGHICNCRPCEFQMAEWGPMLWKAYQER